jgi:outer membrane protein TolC
VIPRPRIRPTLAALLLLGACDMGPAYQRPETEVPPAYRATQLSAQAAWPAADWWTGFASPELTELIEAARLHNFDIAAAAARVQQAAAATRIATAALFPSLTGGGSAAWQHSGVNTSSRTRAGGPSTLSFDTRSYGFGLDASYSVDFWGRNRRAVEAAEQTAQAARFELGAVLLTTQASVANTYFTVLAAREQLVVQEANVTSAERILALLQQRVNAGTANGLDLAQQSTLVAQLQGIVLGKAHAVAGREQERRGVAAGQKL